MLTSQKQILAMTSCYFEFKISLFIQRFSEVGLKYRESLKPTKPNTCVLEKHGNVWEKIHRYTLNGNIKHKSHQCLK